jgi:hypothetical protein
MCIFSCKKWMVMSDANKFQFQNKIWKNSEIQVCNDLCYIYILFIISL